jgi:hypothetical protein
MEELLVRKYNSFSASLRSLGMVIVSLALRQDRVEASPGKNPEINNDDDESLS